MRSMRAGGSPDDRSTRARIRDAAIECFAEHGLAATTARKVAAAAGVSTGLVIHHFGSMDGLRAECDEHVAGTIREIKRQVMVAGPNLDPLAAVREYDGGALMGYLARVLVDGSPAIDELVDLLVADAEEYMQQGVASGTLRPSEDPRRRAAVVAVWSLGSLVLHRHVERLLGIDSLASPMAITPDLTAYLRTTYEMLGRGLMTEEFTEHALDALRQAEAAATGGTESGGGADGADGATGEPGAARGIEALRRRTGAAKRGAAASSKARPDPPTSRVHTARA